MTNLLSRFAKDQSGATAIEYGLIASMIAVAIIVGAKSLGSNLGSKFSTIANNISTGQ